jgi:hypothetical protein
MGTAPKINISDAVAACYKLDHSGVCDVAAVSKMKVVKILSELADGVDS